jgi:CheY-like chemotaxis protein
LRPLLDGAPRFYCGANWGWSKDPDPDSLTTVLTSLEVGSVSEVLGAVAWPLVALCLVLIFRQPILELLRRDEVDLKGPGGIGLSSRRSAAAVSALAKAAAEKPDSHVDPVAIENGVEVVSSDLKDLGRRARLLWVDDRPSNNRYERSALEALNISVDLSTSTEDALQKVASQGPYDLIISDMGRPPDPQAGYTLLGALRDRGDRTPYVIYASSRAPEHFDESVRRGAVGCTNDPTELIEMVSNALRAARR